MSRLYNRVADVTIIDQIGNTRILDKLRISFEVTKSLRGYPNLAKIDIYNANETTLTLLQDKFTTIQLNAGYVGTKALLFSGKVRNLVDTRNATDRITTIYAGDGEQDWQNAIYNRTLSASVPLLTILEEIGATFENSTVGDLSSFNIPADKLRGQSLSGSSKDVLDKLAEDYGFDWSIQNSVLTLVRREDALLPNESVLVSSTTGMIGSPTITEIGADVATLLNPRLEPAKLFTIESAASEVALGDLFFRQVQRTKAEGTYKILEVIHKGDTHDNVWASNLVGVSFVR